jgi:arylsulfatase A-like enzyme
MPEVFSNTFNFQKGKGVMGVRHPDGKMIRTKRWKYNYYPEGFHELYDLENDPKEYNNLADNYEYKSIVAEMKGRLLDWLITASETDQIAEKWLI